MDDVFLTTAEVLEYLRVNLRTVYRLLGAGKLPAVRVGRQWRFRKADVDAWLEEQSSEGGSGVPAAAGPAARQPSRPAASAPARGATPRVLVADDEETVRELLAKTLALAEYDVQTVADGQAAVDRLRAESYQLLITDLRMPGLDGLSVIREARRLYPNLPVVIITGYSSEASAIEAINLGVSGYLTKPFRVAKVLAVAAQALGE
jgi:excisionase family DNA binding protein